MSLDRYTNKEEIVATNGKVRGIVWKNEELLQLDEKNVQPAEKPEVEVHLYTPGEKGRYIGGAILEDEDFELRKDEIFIEWASAAERAGVQRGNFEAVINVHKHVLGDEAAKALYVDEISADRRELHIKVSPNAGIDVKPYLDAWGEEAYRDVIYEMTTDPQGNETILQDEQGNPVVASYIERPLSDDIALNFGENKIFKIINQKDWDEENDFVVRLLHPLSKDIKVKDFLWIVEELADSYIDNINLLGGAVGPGAPIDLRGPNLEVANEYGMVTETDFKNWNQLLDANLGTSQQIVDNMFSGSLKAVSMYGATGLGIDYTSFKNFVHFSSATERIENFKYKLELVQYYDDRIAILNNAGGTDSSSLQGNVTVTRKRKDSVIGSMDGFERWLYNEPTGTLATHGVTGSSIGADTYALESYPKFLSASQYYLYHTTSSISRNWFTGYLNTSSLYDIHNESGLAKTIPEHIRKDENNDQYELFVNMIGHHFDILYTYVNNLTEIYKPQEQPKLGQSKEVLYQVAESLGWKLTNGKQASALWKYKLGVDSGSGKYQTTGSMFSKSDEEITTEVWRRTVNNLPYLLKTKGTTRSIKALMNTFGIPQTLLSIREYGGPKVSGDVPALIEDRFHYALTMNSGSQVLIPNSHISSSIGLGAGGGADWGIKPDRGEIPILSREFRFKPAVTSSMLLLSNYVTGSHAHSYHNNTSSDFVIPNWQLAIEHTGSFSGSGNWGRLHLSQGWASGSSSSIDIHGERISGPEANPMTASSQWVPIYDGEFWNIRYYWSPSGSGIHANEGGHTSYNSGSNVDGAYYVQVQKASDYIKGKVIHSASLQITPNNTDQYLGWSSRNDNQRVYLGGNTGSALNSASWDPDPNKVNQFLTGSGCMNQTKMPGSFSGSIQEYREWLEVFDQRTFDLHTLNPTSYVSAITPTSSYDTLVRHYPFGTELNAVDHSQTRYKIITSSHPNYKQKDFSPLDLIDAYFATATWTFTDKPNEETTITIVDGENTSLVFEVDNDGDGGAGSNIEMDPPSNNAAGMATIMAQVVNASALKITATNPSSGVVVLTQDIAGTIGNTTFTLSNTSNWNANCSVNVPSTFTGGAAPDRSSYNTYASMSGFITPVNAQRGNYHPYEETYYVQGISLGGVLPRSQKIRIEDNHLVRQLDPLVTAERSRQDFAPIDTNALGLFYSAADQINKEIFNNVGDVELDDFVGDPGDEWDNDYKDLLSFSKGYWKKYTDANDVNAFIRIFSQFDFALFEQIKQTLPERVDEAMGVIIEPHALERSKYALTERITKEEPYYETSIPYPAKEITGSYPVYEATMSKAYNISANPIFPADYGNKFRTGSRAGYIETTNTVANFKLTGPTQSADYCTGYIFSGGGSQISVGDRTSSVFADTVTEHGDGARMYNKANPYNSVQLRMGYRPQATASVCAVYNAWRTPEQQKALNEGPGLPWWNLSPATLNGNQFDKVFGSGSQNGSGSNALTGDGMVYNNFGGGATDTTINRKNQTMELRVQFDSALPYDTLQDVYIDVRHFIRMPAPTNLTIMPSSSNWDTKLITTWENMHGMKPAYTASVPHLAALQATTHSYAVGQDWLTDEGYTFRPKKVLANKMLTLTNPSGTGSLPGEVKWHDSWKGYGNPGNLINQVPFDHASSGSIRTLVYENVHIPAFEKLTWTLQVDGVVGHKPTTHFPEVEIGIGSIACRHVVSKVCQNPIQQQIYDPRRYIHGGWRDMEICARKIYHYGSSSVWASASVQAGLVNGPAHHGKQSKYGKNHLYYISKSIDVFEQGVLSYSHSMKPAAYSYSDEEEEFIQITNLKYNGSQLIGPGINQASTIAALGNSPVVEIFGTNPNRMIFRDPPEEGRPGRILVR